MMNNEIIDLIITIAPSVTAIIGIIVSILVSLKRLGGIISEFRQSNEVKGLVSQLKKQSEENAQLKKMNEKLLVELRRIAPKGWVDDEFKN